MEDYASLVRAQPGFSEAFDLAKNNSEGKVFIVGGSVYRTISRALHGGKRQPCDFDFVVERVRSETFIPKEWRVTDADYNWGDWFDAVHMSRDQLGSQRFTRESDGFQVDLIALSTLPLVLNKGLPATLDSYLRGVPLTVQSLALDLESDKIWGAAGWKSILERKVAVHNMIAAQYSARKRGISVIEYVEEKANSLGFEPIFPSPDELLAGRDELPILRCAVCHDDFYPDDKVCEGKSSAGMYLHDGECGEICGKDLYALGVNYAQLIEKIARVKREHPEYLAGQVYEAVRACDFEQKRKGWFGFLSGLWTKRDKSENVRERVVPRHQVESKVQKDNAKKIPFPRDNKTI